ncbi:hypothetical protein [Sellimonas intestinalis]|uniref:hypothetical protein n=1 Tax=Sellimonas intestinalis TaxID=1653434 RepID=UPI00399C0619
MSIIDERLEEIRIVPVVKIERAEDAKGLAGALKRWNSVCGSDFSDRCGGTIHSPDE